MITRKTAVELWTGIRHAASLLTGAKRRCFQAQIATEYCNANPRQTESWFGFNRHAVQRGLLEKEAGKTLRKTPERRGRPKVEDKLPQLAQLTDQALSETAQMDPKFQTTIAYTRVTGKQLRESFAQTLGIAVGKLPVARTLRRLMNRRNFSLRRVRKTQPLKKIEQTDAIFDNVKQAHQRAANDPSILRISIDNKAKVKVGPFSRGGSSRKASDRRAADHDMATCPLLVPCGILEIASGQLMIGFGQGISTSDTVADNLEQWWCQRKTEHPNIRKLMIDLDNGPEVSSQRTQFMKRLTQFADKHNIEIELVYYPPYHSKYNAIERCWGALEKHWNGTLLTTIPIVLKWAQSMTWKGIRPIVRMLNGVYARGVKLNKSEYAPIAARLQRIESIEKWSVTISPQLLSAP